MSEQIIRALHITDPHLFGDENGVLMEENTLQSLQSVLSTVAEKETTPDVILSTGDLCHDLSDEGYGRLRDEMARLKAPVYCLPGNHDDPVAMSRVLKGDPIHIRKQLLLKSWQIIMLNSMIPGENGGVLPPAEMVFLEMALAANKEIPALICVHHHPVPMKSAWLDTMMIKNPEDLFAVIDRHEQVRGVLFGHVHQEFEVLRKEVKLMASPSTCVQFKPRSEAFALDHAAPGYRWLNLRAGGKMETGVVRTAQFESTVDPNAKGY